MRDMAKASEVIRKMYGDQTGNSIAAVYEDGDLIERTTYNSHGQMIETLQGNLKTVYVYNAEGDEVECHQYYIHEDNYEEYIFSGFKKYDEEGRLIEYEYDNIHEGHFHFTYKYDVFEGKLVRKAYNDNSELVDLTILN